MREVLDPELVDADVRGEFDERLELRDVAAHSHEDEHDARPAGVAARREQAAEVGDDAPELPGPRRIAYTVADILVRGGAGAVERDVDVAGSRGDELPGDAWGQQYAVGVEADVDTTSRRVADHVEQMR